MMKSQVNIKKGALTELDQAEAGKPFAFEIKMVELFGKSDDAVLILAATNQAEYDEWMASVSSCFGIKDARRRKSSIIGATADIVAVTNTSTTVEDKSSTPEESKSDVKAEIENIICAMALLTNTTDISEAPPAKVTSDELGSKTPEPAESFQAVASTSEDNQAIESIPSTDSVGNQISKSLQDKLKSVKSKKFSPPKFKNLINDNGRTFFEPKLAVDVKSVTNDPPRELSPHIRPTEPTRMGYLLKFDASANESGHSNEECWINQFASLEIAAGMLLYYAEIAG